jgi:hypothetical protein
MNLKLILTGSLLTHSFVRFEYSYPDHGPLQFGTILCELDPIGTVLSGEFVGYGPITKRILSGKIRLTKELGTAKS